MDDANITKQAIDEILKEMNVYKEYGNRGQERKMNPLGKPNKRFLDRTLNSVLNHNKRESERTRKLCQRKLRHLDRKRKKIENRKVKRAHRKVPSSTYITNNNNDSTDDEKYNVRKRKKHKQTKKKKSRKRKVSKYRSSSSSDDENMNSKNINGGKSLSRQNADRLENKRQALHMYDNVEHVNWNNYYADANLASFTTLAYNHHVTRLWWQHQQFVNQHIPANNKPSNSDTILSDLTLNSSSETSFNISVNGSSAEEDEKGILTFQLSSDYNEDDHDDKSHNHNHDNVLGLADDDNCSIQTHISLNSDECPAGKQKSNALISITLLSTDSEVENENGKSSATTLTTDLSANKLIVDLTED